MAVPGRGEVSLRRAASTLGATELFADLDPEILNRLGERTIERRFRRGQLVFGEGDPGDSLFIVVDGLVKVFVTSDEGEEMVLITLRNGDTFGELALIDGRPRSASAQALEPTTTLVVTRDELLDLMRAHPALAESLLGSLGALVRRLTEQAADLVFLDLHGRVAKLLVHFAAERGPVEEPILDLHLTQSDLAAMVGGSRQSVNQILGAFEKRGYIELRGRTIVLKRMDLLSRRAGL
jgi:CRP/FNR family transcriptional regulator, cyclic AMP receptor protein